MVVTFSRGTDLDRFQQSALPGRCLHHLDLGGFVAPKKFEQTVGCCKSVKCWRCTNLRHLVWVARTRVRPLHKHPFPNVQHPVRQKAAPSVRSLCSSPEPLERCGYANGNGAVVVVFVAEQKRAGKSIIEGVLKTKAVIH